MGPFKILVTGGRLFGSEVDEQDNLTPRALRERLALRDCLDSWLKFHAGLNNLELATGGASGADALAGEWAQERHVPVRVYQARWKELGKLAGPERNRRMVSDFRPAVVLAFPGGRGTENCKRTARMMGLPVLEVLV